MTDLLRNHLNALLDNLLNAHDVGTADYQQYIDDTITAVREHTP